MIQSSGKTLFISILMGISIWNSHAFGVMKDIGTKRSTIHYHSSRLLVSSIETEAPTVSSTENEAKAETSKQSQYGVSLDLPDTYINCGKCDTSYAIREEDLGEGKGCRVVCPVCDHSWFQSRDRLRSVNSGSELVPLPETDKSRIAANIEAGRKPSYVGAVKFYVGNLDFRATESDIYDVFKTVGEVGDVSLVTDEDGRSRGFAFVTMMEKESTDACMKLDGTEINGRSINVKPPNN